MKPSTHTYWQIVWKQFSRRRLGMAGLVAIFLFILAGIYAPLLASSKPLFVEFQGKWYFPLFRYLFYPQFFTKGLDIFYNLMMFTFPLFLFAWGFLVRFPRTRLKVFAGIAALQIGLFLYLIFFPPQDPAASLQAGALRQKQMLEVLKEGLGRAEHTPVFPSWNEELKMLSPYAQLNLVLRFRHYQLQRKNLESIEEAYGAQAKKTGRSQTLFPSLWNLTYHQEEENAERQSEIAKHLEVGYVNAKARLLHFEKKCPAPGAPPLDSSLSCQLTDKEKQEMADAKILILSYERAQAQSSYLQDKRKWLEEQAPLVRHVAMPLLRPFHWEDDAGGDQGLNRFVSWWDLTRINRKDMVAALIFGIRVSLSVGLLAIALGLSIGIPIGAFAGYYGGRLDLITYRLIEIWESMPTFFMLLMIVAFLQSKSIFLVIAVIGLFGWTGFSRFIRGEFFRQKELPYVEACRALGFDDLRIIFSHLLPNALPPLLTLVPFAIMGAITAEAGLSFLGLGEEGSNSWGVLMDEGRSAFPSESYLLWPPAILLTLLLVSIALVGDALRDALDPKLQSA